MPQKLTSTGIVSLLDPQDIEMIESRYRISTFREMLNRFLASDAKTQWIDEEGMDPDMILLFHKIRLFLKPTQELITDDSDALDYAIVAYHDSY